MPFQYHTEELRRILRDFQSITGISVGIANASFDMLVSPDPVNRFCALIQSTPRGAKRCAESDSALLSECQASGRICSHRCHAGLTDTAVPITKDGIVLGYILFGQLLQFREDPTPFDEVYPALSDLGLCRKDLEQAYRSLSFLEQEQLESAAAIIERLAKYIWLEHLIDLHANDPFDQVIEYINANLQKKHTVAALCRKFGISKNLLYEKFKQILHCTVNEYLTARRLEEAKRLLCTTDLPIYMICEQVGLDNYQYFCRRFKRITEQTPLQYRKQFTNHQNPKGDNHV